MRAKIRSASTRFHQQVVRVDVALMATCPLVPRAEMSDALDATLAWFKRIRRGAQDCLGFTPTPPMRSRGT